MASGQDAAAYAGAKGHTDHVRIALCTADPHLAQRHAVGVVGHCDGQAEVLFQRRLDRAADVIGKVAAGTGHDAFAAVDLTGGRNADARKTFHRDGICGQKLLCGPAHGGENRRLVAVKADALFALEQHPAGLVHDAQLDGSAADINAKILFHPAHSILLFCGVDAPVKRAVISAGR